MPVFLAHDDKCNLGCSRRLDEGSHCHPCVQPNRSAWRQEICNGIVASPIPLRFALKRFRASPKGDGLSCIAIRNDKHFIRGTRRSRKTDNLGDLARTKIRWAKTGHPIPTCRTSMEVDIPKAAVHVDLNRVIGLVDCDFTRDGRRSQNDTAEHRCPPCRRDDCRRGHRFVLSFRGRRGEPRPTLWP